MLSGCDPLPIDPFLPELTAILRERDLVLQAEPGSGKTTRLPWALLEAGLLEKLECWVLEPRRLAVRLAAQRVAQEREEVLGERVGFALRFEQRVSPRTRIRYVTEALLLRRFQADPLLKDIGIVVLDEFHERSLHLDLALALLRRLKAGPRPDLRLVLMSATLDASNVASELDAVGRTIPGRSHPVDIHFAPRPDSRPLALKVRTCVEGLLREGQKGHILVFLAGAAEIRACLKTCADLPGIRPLPLHGELSMAAQEEALAPSPLPKLILSTNVAESSVTLEGVTSVIDTGWARQMDSTGLSRLRTVRISQARCIQRAGRAGRQGPGRCIRLFTEADYLARPTFDPPEILRSEFTESLLLLLDLGVRPGELPWLTPPPSEALARAQDLLQRLGAMDASGLTKLGQRMASLPLHPRLARLLLSGEALGCPDLACTAAALLEEGELLSRLDLDRTREELGTLEADLFADLDRFQEAQASHFATGAIRAMGLEPAKLLRVEKSRRSLRRLLHAPLDDREADERLLLRALLDAFPDRVAKRGSGRGFLFENGSGAVLASSCRTTRWDWILALSTRQDGAQVLIDSAARLEPDWLLDTAADRLQESSQLAFNPQAQRVEKKEQLWMGQICLMESTILARPGDPGVAECLASGLLASGLDEWEGPLQRLRARLAFLARFRPDFPNLEEASFREWLIGICLSASSRADLQGWDLAQRWFAELEPTQRQLLEAWAPDSVRLPKRSVKVEYPMDGDPWIASRLQDFLGLAQGPSIAGGQQPLILHLLAPNFRAVQITTDLAGFWKRAYQELRPQLSRRYPKHAWPEKPENNEM